MGKLYKRLSTDLSGSSTCGKRSKLLQVYPAIRQSPDLKCLRPSNRKGARKKGQTLWIRFSIVRQVLYRKVLFLLESGAYNSDNGEHFVFQAPDMY